jgi:hypothetical protein
MEAIKSETSSLRGATRSWCILLTNLSNHLNRGIGNQGQGKLDHKVC